MNPIAIRLLAQQLASPQFASPHDIVSHFGTMQAQDYRMMRWTVVMRMRRPSAEAFCKAFYDGEIIRLHLLRGTWQLVSCDDYPWWSGLTIAECLRGMDALGAELSKDSWKGYEFHIHESCRRRGFRKGKSLLLPPFDEYMIGYKSREIVFHPTHVHHAHTNNGIFFPIIARDGVICGNWSPWEKELKTSLFMPIEEDLAFGEQWKYFSLTKDLL